MTSIFSIIRRTVMLPNDSLSPVVDRRSVGIFSLAFALVILVFFFDPLFLPRTFAMRDLVPFFFPIEKAVHAAWRSGHIPLLFPEISFGRPLAANPNTGAFYPVRVAMALFPFSFAIRLFPIFHCWLAGVGTFLLCRFLGISRPGSALAGILFALSGPTLAEFSYPDFLPGLAMMPFVIVSAGALSRRPSARRAALFGLAWGIALLIGDVFTAGLALFGAVLLSIDEAPQGKGRALFILLAVTMPGFLLAGIQLIPAILFVPHTVRALGRLPLGTALMWSVSPWRLLELVVPHAFGNVEVRGPLWGDGLWYGKSGGFFSTLHCGVFGVIALFSEALPRRLRRFGYGLLFFSAFCSVAGWYLPKSLSGSPSPIPLRYPEKFFVGAALALAIIAGTWLDRVRAGRARRSWIIAAGVAMMLFLVCAMTRLFPPGVAEFVDRNVSTVAHAGRWILSALREKFLWAAILWAAVALVLLARPFLERRRIFVLAVLVTAIVNAAWLRWSLLFTYPESQVLTPLPSAYAVRRINHGEIFGFFPVTDYYGDSNHDLAWLNSDYAALHGIAYSFNADYDFSDLYRVDLARRELKRQEKGWPGIGGFLGAFSARTTIDRKGRRPAGFPHLVRVVGETWIYENPEALPRFRFATDAIEVPDVRSAYDLIALSDLDLSRETVIETGFSRRERLSGGRIFIDEQSCDRIRLRTNTDGPARLILPLAYFPYRRIAIDGNYSSHEPTNLCLTSVSVPSGSHVVSVAEQLPGGSLGPMISGVGLLAIVFLGTRGSN